MQELQKWFLAFAPFTLATFKHCLNFNKVAIVAKRRITITCIFTKMPIQQACKFMCQENSFNYAFKNKRL